MKSPLKTTKEVVINEGQGVSAIADILKEENVIDNKFAFVVYVIVTGNEKKLQAGRYIFKPGVTTLAIVNSMVEGFAESDDIVITIPEGFNVFDIDKRLASAGLTKEGEFAKKYQNNEGQFFPDTYRLSQMLATDSYDLITVLRQKAADNYDEKNRVIINNGILESGTLKGSIINNIITRISNPDDAIRYVSDLQYVSNIYLRTVVFSVGISDCLIGKCSKDNITKDFIYGIFPYIKKYKGKDEEDDNKDDKKVIEIIKTKLIML